MNKKIIVSLVSIFCLLVIIGFVFNAKTGKSGFSEMSEVNPIRGNMQVIISSTGTVSPKNRLEIKPPVNGRVESVLVKEGERVQPAVVLAWMSSTERAALLDAASEQGEEKLAYWQQVYKPIPLKSPIEGEVIVSTIQAGQTVTTSDAVLVLSDELIVQAQVDETDIGKIKKGQKAIVKLDAYPQQTLEAEVHHIYYESKTVNNVIVYKIDLWLENIPDFFRSGMSASIDFIIEKKTDVLMLPVDAINQDKKESYVWLKQPNSRQPVKQTVTLGISQEDFSEVTSGIQENDIVLMGNGFALSTESVANTKNPFMPARRSTRVPTSKGR